MAKKRLTETDILNFETSTFLEKRFELLAINQFEWIGLPDTIQERHIEKTLYYKGFAIFFKDPVNGFLCLPGAFGRGVNVYGDPLSYRVTGFNYSKTVSAKDAVLIENNKLRMPTKMAVDFFVNQLYEILRTRDVNLKTLKIPFLISCKDQDLLTYKKVLEKIDENNYAIFGERDFNLGENVKVFQTGAKCLAGELTDLYHDCFNEALTYLGINNANTDKRERLITSEADANNQLIDSCSEMFLEARQRAAEKISEILGQAVTVRPRVNREQTEQKEDAHESLTS